MKPSTKVVNGFWDLGICLELHQVPAFLLCASPPGHHQRWTERLFCQSILLPFFLIGVWNVIVLKDGFTRLCPCFMNSINQFTWCVAFASPLLKMVVDRTIRVLPVLMLGCSFQPLLWASVMNNDVTWSLIWLA